MKSHCPSHGEVLGPESMLHCPLCGLPLLVTADGGHGLRWLDDRNRPDYGPDAAWRMSDADAEMLRRVSDPADSAGKATLRAGPAITFREAVSEVRTVSP